MKFRITLKTRLLLFLIMCIAALVGTIVSFFISEETDGFRIFGRGFSIFVFLYFSIDYLIRYLRESKKLQK